MRMRATRTVFRPRLALPLAGAIALASGCLYLPPVRHTAGDSTLRRAQAEADSRAAMASEIGRADVLRTRAVWVHDWLQSYGYIVAGYSGSELTGKPHRVLVRFDGDTVTGMEVAAPPPLVAAMPEEAVLKGCAGDDRRRAVIALAAGGGTIAAIDSKGSLCVWTDLAPEGRLAVPVVGLEKKLLSFDGAVAVSADGRLVAAASDLAVVVWDVAKGRVAATATRPRVSTWSRPRRASSAAFSADGTRLAVAGPESLFVIDTATGREAWSVVKGPLFEAIAFTPDGARVFGSDLGGQLVDYDAVTGRLLAQVAERNVLLPDLLPVESPADRLQPRRVVFAGRAALETWDLDALERRYESTGAAVRTLEDVAVPELLEARLLPLAALTPKVDFGWPPLAPCGRSVALSPDGTLLAEQLCQEVRLLRMPTLELVAAYDSTPALPEPPAPPPGAEQAVTDGDVPTTRVATTPRRPRPGPVAWTPDGRKLIQAIGVDLVVRGLPPAP